jgi:integration host factor subunit beta
MIKSELVSLIASQYRHLHHSDVDRIVDTVLDEIADTLVEGGRVELRGFGIFSIRNRPSRSGRNPRTGTSVLIEEKWVPFFHAGKEIQDRLNPATAGEAPAKRKLRRSDP